MANQMHFSVLATSNQVSIDSTNMRLVAMRGGTWSLSSQGLRLVCQIGSIIILARLLTPQEFGLVGILMSTLGVVGLFRHIGLSTAIIQAETVTEPQLRRLLEITLILGFILLIVTCIVGLALARIMNDPRIIWIAPWYGLTFALSSFEAVPQSLLRRRMMFRQIALREVASTLLGTTSSILAAYLGAGYWSLIVGMLITAFTDAITSWITARWKPSSVSAPWRDVLSFLRFGGAFTGSSLAAYFSQNLDSLLIGRILGYEQLGYYSRARSLMIQPMNQFLGPITTILLPIFCRVQTEEARFRKIIVTLSVPFLTLPCILATWIMVGASEIVTILLGTKWLSVTPILIWLAASIIYLPFGALLHLVLLASGKGRLLIHWAWSSALIVICGYAATVSYGTTWVAASFTLTGIILRIPLALYISGRTGLMDTWGLARLYLGSLAFAGLLLALLYSSKRIAVSWSSNEFVILATISVTAGVLTGLALLIHPVGRSVLSKMRKPYIKFN
jgi:O-antigen/teichoic acid export membrane protein